MNNKLTKKDIMNVYRLRVTTQEGTTAFYSIEAITAEDAINYVKTWHHVKDVTGWSLDG